MYIIKKSTSLTTLTSFKMLLNIIINSRQFVSYHNLIMQVKVFAQSTFNFMEIYIIFSQR